MKIWFEGFAYFSNRTYHFYTFSIFVSFTFCVDILLVLFHSLHTTCALYYTFQRYLNIGPLFPDRLNQKRDFVVVASSIVKSPLFWTRQHFLSLTQSLKDVCDSGSLKNERMCIIILVLLLLLIFISETCAIICLNMYMC